MGLWEGIHGFDCWVETFPIKERRYERRCEVTILALNWREEFHYVDYIEDEYFRHAVYSTVDRILRQHAKRAFIHVAPPYSADMEAGSERAYLGSNAAFDLMCMLAFNHFREYPDPNSNCIIVPEDRISDFPWPMEEYYGQRHYPFLPHDLALDTVIEMQTNFTARNFRERARGKLFCYYPERNLLYVSP